MKARATAFSIIALVGRRCSQPRTSARMTLYVAMGITIPMILKDKQILALMVRSAKGMTVIIQLPAELCVSDYLGRSFIFKFLC